MSGRRRRGRIWGWIWRSATWRRIERLKIAGYGNFNDLRDRGVHLVTVPRLCH